MSQEGEPRVDDAGSPFASGGGGTLFEYRVAAHYLSYLITGELVPDVGTPVLSIQFQPTGVGLFDDFVLECADDATPRRDVRVHVQVRHRQPLTRSNAKFRALVRSAAAQVSTNTEKFERAELKLLLVVGPQSPAWHSLRELCQLSRRHPALDRFLQGLQRHGQPVRERYKHFTATGALDDPTAHATLRALTVAAVDWNDLDSNGAVDAINRLARLWSPSDRAAGRALLLAAIDHVESVGPTGATVDADSIASSVTVSLPTWARPANRRTRLNALMRAATGRIEGRLRALGVPDDLCPDVTSHAIARATLRYTPDSMFVLEGPIGVGKSTELERLHIGAIRDALGGATHAVPIRLEAAELANTALEAIVAERCAGIGDPATAGVHIIIDSLDEAGMAVPDVVPHAYSVIRMWPGTTVTVATRPGLEDLTSSTAAGLTDSLVRREARPLSFDEAEALLRLFGLRANELREARPELADALHRPLFAILFALHRRRGETVSPAGLVSRLAESIVAELTRRHGNAFVMLQMLASKVLDAAGGPVEPRSAGINATDLQLLLDSRVVQVKDGRADLQLAVLTEWFAAERLLSDPVLAEEIAADPVRSRRWRYAFAQAIGRATEAVADVIMAPLVRSRPLLAGWVLHESSASLASRGATPQDPEPVASGKRLRHALDEWHRAVGPAVGVMNVFDEDGALRPLAIDVSEGVVTVAWWRGTSSRASVTRLDETLRPTSATALEWGPIRYGPPQAGAAWPWRWTLDDVSKLIESFVHSGEVAATANSFFAELCWRYAYGILDKDATVQSAPVPIAALEAAIARVERHVSDAGDVMVGGRRGWLLSEARSFVQLLHELRIQSVAPPWPSANSRGGWTWDWWTTDQLLERLTRSTAAALDGYAEMVKQWMPGVYEELLTASILPARVVGQLYPGERGGGYEHQPQMQWHIEPREHGPNDAVWRTIEEPPTLDIDFDAYRRQLQRLRPMLDDRVTLRVHGGHAEVFSPTPASRFARTLLNHDLRDFGWTVRTFPLDSNDPLLAPTPLGRPKVRAGV